MDIVASAAKKPPRIRVDYDGGSDGVSCDKDMNCKTLTVKLENTFN